VTSALNLLDPTSIVQTLGILGVTLTLFAETGLLVGVFLPGDSLLFVAGLAASVAATESFGFRLPLGILLAGSAVAAIVGAQVGYLIGHKYGRPLFARQGRFFNQGKVARAEALLERYGVGRGLGLARFIPFVRTVIPPMCGILGVPRRTYTLWNVVGGIVWTQTVILLGFFLGERIEGSVDRYILPIIGGIIIVSVFPIAIDALRHWRRRRQSPRSASE
jgi:membrane-associated protein